MREDASKIFSKRMRSYQNNWGRRGNRRYEGPAPKQERMRHAGTCRDSYLYRPALIGFLRKSVGEYWSKVYSELSKSFKGRNRHQMDDLLSWYVELHPVIKDSVAYYPNRKWGLITSGGRGHGSKFYVNYSGILRIAPTPEKWKSKKKKQDTVKLSDMKELILREGIWYLAEYKSISGGEARLKAALATAALFMGRDLLGNYNNNRICVKLSQLSKRALRKYNLKNGK